MSTSPDSIRGQEIYDFACAIRMDALDTGILGMSAERIQHIRAAARQDPVLRERIEDAQMGLAQSAYNFQKRR